MMKVFFQLSVAFLSTGLICLQAQVSQALSINEVENIAQKITVRIPEKTANGKEANGSGFLIAKEGNTYTVLTANHVVCDKNPAEETCNLKFQEIKVVTHDKEEYLIDYNTVKKLPGVDLAILKFTSSKNYQLATLADYDHNQVSTLKYRADNGQIIEGGYGQFVFASGWPGINHRNITKLNYKFSIGKLLPPDKMVGFQIRPPALGYNAVYTSITFPGMSGGPVLDTDGRVIAIHGQNEGEKVIEESSNKRIPIPIGYSLSIPIQKFLELSSNLKINLNIDKNLPIILTEEDLDDIGTYYILSWTRGEEIPIANSAAYWAYQGNQYWRDLKTPLAFNAYNKALELDPDFYPVMYGKGLIETFEADYSEAIGNYDQALQVIDKKILEDSSLQEIRGWVKNLREKIQPFVANSSGGSQPAVPRPAPVTNTPSTNNPPAPPQNNQQLW